MEKTLKILLIILGLSTLLLLGTFVGYTLFKPKPENTAQADEAPGPQRQAAALAIPAAKAGVSGQREEVITLDTKMIYEYVYGEDGVTERVEEPAPYFLMEMDESMIAGLFPGWEIVSFSVSEVFLRKEMPEGSKMAYIVGVQNGFVSVFVDSPASGRRLKEMTDTPTAALSEEEQARLEAGVTVKGEEELMRVLETYGS